MIVWIAMCVGIGDSLVRLILETRGSAIYAQRHHQISYERFSKMLTSSDIDLKQENSLKAKK
jgi:hypothetical protein